jgi:hypothetical protein
MFQRLANKTKSKKKSTKGDSAANADGYECRVLALLIADTFFADDLVDMPVCSNT